MSKKKYTNKNNMHYGPKYKHYYDILDNINAYRSAGARLLTADREYSAALDRARKAEEAKWKRQQRRELERIENAKRQEREKDISRAASQKPRNEEESHWWDPIVNIFNGPEEFRTSPISMQDGLNNTGYKMPSAEDPLFRAAEVWGRELANDPENAILLVKDNWNDFFLEINRLQSEDYNGLITRGQALSSDIEGYRTYLNILLEIDKIDQQLGSLRGEYIEGNKAITPDTKKLITDLSNEKIQLKNSQKQYELAKKNIEDYSPTLLGKMWDDVMASTPDTWLTKAESIVGKTTPFRDLLNDVTRFLYGIGDDSKSPLERLLILDRASKQLSELNKDWIAGSLSNLKEMEQYKASKNFRTKADNTRIDFTNPDTYLYKLGGLLGGSSSSYMKQLPAIALLIGVGVFTGGSGFTATAAANAAAGAASFGMQYGAGASENNAEVALAFKERLTDELQNTEYKGSTLYNSLIKEGRKKLGTRAKSMTDEEVFDAWRMGLYNSDMPAVNRKKLQALRGINNQFRSDMVATTSDAAVNTVLNMIPFGKAAKGSMIRNAKASALHGLRKISPELAQRITRVGSAFELGSAINPLGGTVAAAGRFAIDPWVTKAGVLGKNISNRISKIADVALNNDFKHVVKRGVRNKYLKDIAGRVITSGISEGIEEGKQAVNAQKYKSGAYDRDNVGVASMLFNDFISGSRMAGLMLGMPFEGWMSKADQDMLQEIKGGMIGGMGHTGLILVLSQARPYVREKNAANILVENILASKLGDTDAFEKGIMYSKHAAKSWNPFRSTDRGAIQLAFETIRDLNKQQFERTGEYLIDDQYIKDEEDSFHDVVSTSLSPITQQQAYFQGIKRNSLDYHEFVAVKSILQDAVKESLKSLKDINAQVNAAENEIRQQSAELSAEFGYDYGDVSLTADQVAELDVLYNTRVSKLAALFTMRDKISAALENGIVDNKVKTGLVRQLNRINNQIKLLKKDDPRTHELNTVDEAMTAAKSFAVNVEDQDSLLNLYLQLAQAVADYNLAVDALNDFTGVPDQKIDPNRSLKKQNIKFLNGNARRTLRRIHEAKERDDEFESMIETQDLSGMDLEEQYAAEGELNRAKIVTGDPNLNIDTPVYVENEDETGKKTRRHREYDSSYILANGEFVDPKTDLVWRRNATNPETPQPPTTDSQQEDERVDKEFEQSWKDVEEETLPAKDDETKSTNHESTPPEDEPEQTQTGEPKEEAALSDNSDRKEEPTTKVSDVEGENSEDEFTEEPEPTPVPKKPTPPQTPAPESKQILVDLAKQHSDAQHDTLDILGAKQEADKESVLNDLDGYHTTNSDYFILVDGIPTRMSRVHSVKPAAYISLGGNNDVLLLVQKLRDLGKDKQKILDWLNETQDPEFVDLIPYIKYIEDRFDDIVSNEKEYQAVLTSIANQIVSRYTGPSVEVGNIIDGLARDFFEFPFLPTEVNTDSSHKEFDLRTEELFEGTAKNGHTYREIFDGNISAFAHVLSQMWDLVEYFDKLGWIVSTLPYTWHAKFPKVGWVAGETDMIAVDKNGDVHIIDFKTSFGHFDQRTYSKKDIESPNVMSAQTRSTYYNAIRDLENKYLSEIQSLTSKDIQTSTGKQRMNKKARNLISKMRKESGISELTFRAKEDGDVELVVKWARFTSLENPSLVLTQEEDYSNQQTVYAMLIDREIGSTVKSVSIMPFVCNYTQGNTIVIQNVDNKNADGEVLIIPLKFQTKLKNELLGKSKPQRLKEKDFALESQADSIIRELERLLVNLNNYSLNLDDVSRTMFDSLKQLENEISALLSEKLTQEILDSAVATFTSFKDTYDTLLEYIASQIDTDNTVATNQATSKSIVKQGEKHEKSDETPPPTGTRTHVRPTSSFNIPTDLDWVAAINNPVLTDLTNAPNLITTGDFELFVEGETLFCNITLGDKSVKRVIITTKDNRENWTTAGAALYSKVLALQNSKKEGQRIVADRSTISRTNGRLILHGKDGSQLLAPNKSTGTYAVRIKLPDGKWSWWRFVNTGTVEDESVEVPALESGLFAESDIYDIEFTRSYGKVGFVNKGQVQTFNGIIENGTISDESRTAIYTWEGTSAETPQDGTLVYLKKQRRNELSRDSVIPVTLDKKHFTQRDIDFIINIITSNLLDLNYLHSINGEEYNLGVTGRQLLNLLIPIAESAADIKNIRSLVIDPLNPGQVWLINSDDIASRQTAQHKYDLFNPASRLNFINEMLNLSVAERHDVLMSRLGNVRSEYKNRLPFENIMKFFGYYANPKTNGVPITTLDISDSLLFDFEDFMDHKSSDGSIKRGLSGLGWYLKHGIITTRYAGMSSSNVEIKDAVLEDVVPPEQEVILDETDITIAENPEVSSVDTWDFIDDAAIYKTVPIEVLHTSKLTSREEINAHLREIFGDSYVDFTIIDTIHGMSGADAAVIGHCTADALRVYEHAVRGTEYHEAFHRIFELIIDDRLRDSIYKLVARRLGVDLNKNPRVIAEWVADRFMDYANDIHTNKQRSVFGIKLPNLISKAFNRVVNFVNALRLVGNFRLANLYVQAKNGYWSKHEHLDKITQKKIDRFNKLYKDLHYEVNGVELKSIINDAMYDKVKNSVAYLLMIGNRIDPAGSNISDLQITLGALRNGINIANLKGLDLLGEHSDSLTVGQEVMRDVYNHITEEGLRDDLAAYLSDMSTNVDKLIEEDNDEDAQGDEESVVGSSIGEHTRASYEFSRFDKASRRIRFFLSTIPAVTRDGRYLLNEYGLPAYLNSNYVFNELISNLCSCNTIQEVLDRLHNLRNADPMYNIIGSRILRLAKTAYIDQKRNADLEALLALLMTVIKSHKHIFLIIKANRDADGKYTLKLQNSDTDYVADYFSKLWGLNLAYGATDIIKLNQYGQLVFNPKDTKAPYITGSIAAMFDKPSTVPNKSGWFNVGIKLLLSNTTVSNPSKMFMNVRILDELNSTPENPIFKVVSIIDLTDPKQLRVVKQKLISALNYLGIQINMDEFDYMLSHKYGSVDHVALNQMFQSSSEKDSMQSFLSFLNNISKNGTLNINYAKLYNMNGKLVNLEDIYSKMAFVRELANYKQQYNHAHDQLTTLATDNKKYYIISDNNYITDTAEGLNRRNWMFDLLIADPFAYYEDTDNTNAYGRTPIYGSVILKEMKADPNLMISIGSFVGFKTNAYDDGGADYFAISLAQDYVSKLTMLEDGAIIFPTMSDKKTWQYVLGVTLPGINYKNIDSKSLQKVLVPDDILSQYRLTLDDAVCSQMLEYAMCEYRAIKIAQAKLHQMTEEERKSDVVNYYTKMQGAKFASLLGVYVDGGFKSFNTFKNNTLEEIDDNIEQAEKYFFNDNISVEERKAMIAELLNRTTLGELNQAERLGLIQKNNLNDKCPYYNYVNVGLNDPAINSIYDRLIPADGKLSDTEIARLKSLALCIYLNDLSNKSIMSIHEIEKVFTGNPAFYKWKYDKDGKLIDRTVDELKRFGGPGSTGFNNFVEIEDVPKKYLDSEGNFTHEYVCAEVDNEEVSSPIYEDLKEQMLYGELLNAVYNEYDGDVEVIENKTGKQLEELTKEELEKLLPEFVLKIANRKAKQASDSYAKGIDVADGGAYMTDTMTEMLLRMVGSYSAEILEAFRILREEVPSTYLQKQQMYRKVLTTVIGTLKYTAFGKRNDNGLLTTYYDKFALFPLFDCLATGRMKNVYDKMKQQGIDVLKVNSAIKVGSKGSKPINWSEFRQNSDENDSSNYINGEVGDESALKPIFEDSFEFNTYNLKFEYLRKQLNTDPKEEDEMAMGTQMTKIALSNLLLNRTYISQGGVTRTGEEIRDSIMSHINALSEEGAKNIKDRFFTDGIVDVNKTSKELIKMLSARSSDSSLQKAMSVVPVYDESTGEITSYQTVLPLEAMSNESLVESVLASTINKQVIDINTPGAAFIQRSIWAMEQTALYSRSSGGILSDSDLSSTINNGNKLKMINEEGSMDCILSLDFFEKIIEGGIPTIPHVGKDGKMRSRKRSFTEARQWLIDNNIIGPNAKANIVGYRIPTQAQSSIHALRCVDILPVVNDTVILPEEFTKITGSDFDIDKLFLSALSYGIDYRIEPESGIEHQIITSDYEQGTAQYHSNALIRDYLTLLLDKTSEENGTPRSSNILHRSIDNDTLLLKDRLSELGLETSTTEDPYAFYTLSKQTDSKNDYITGKIGIGPFALNNNNHILTMLYGVRFKRNGGSIMDILDLTRLDRHVDQDGESILSWESALINAHVDIAKDPFISKLNVNKFTYNLTNLLIRTGFGKKTFYFLGQPIMKELAKAYEQSQSKYMKNPNISQYKLWKDAQELIMQRMIGFDYEIELLDHSKITVKDALDIINSKKRTKSQRRLLYSINNSFKDSLHTLQQEAKLYNTEGNYNKNIQALVYLAYLQMNPYATALSNLVKYCKIDTKKQGKSLLELLAFEDGYERLVDKGSLFEPDGLYDLLSKSYISTKTKSSISLMRDILQNLLLCGSDPIRDAIKKIAIFTGREDLSDVALNKKIAKAISSYLKSTIINKYIGENRKENPDFIHDLVSPSKESVPFEIKQGLNTVKLTGSTHHPINTYVGTTCVYTFTGQDGNLYSQPMVIVGADTKTNTLYTSEPNRWNYSGTLLMYGGQNTILDRTNRLMVALLTKPKYAGMLDENGKVRNELLKQLVNGAVIECGQNDTYEILKFVKLFNSANDSDTNANYIRSGWEELLNSEFPEIRKFAEDLVFYAFVTSGDLNGFTKMFKYVPVSWKINSGFGKSLNDMLYRFSNRLDYISLFLAEDIILNNWYDDQFVPVKYMNKKNATTGVYEELFKCTYRDVVNQYGNVVHLSSEPILMAAICQQEDGTLVPTIDPDTAPRFIKVRKKTTSNNSSLDSYNVYKLISVASTSTGISYPVYGKVRPKGNRVYRSGTYHITEYGRSDRNNPYDKTDYNRPLDIQGLVDWINSLLADDVAELESKYGKTYSDIIEDLYRNSTLMSFEDNVSEEEILEVKEADDMTEEMRGESPVLFENLNPLTRTMNRNTENILSEEEMKEAEEIKKHCKGE